MRATFALFVVALPGFTQALRLTDKSYTPCHGANELTSVDITPCDEEPCALTQGTVVDVIMTGTSGHDFDNINLKMDAQIESWVPILDDAVCGTSLECPVRTSSDWTMNYAYEVDGRFPEGGYETRWKLVGNSDDDELTCALVQLQVA